jgi:hypothetical protein
MAGQTGVSIIQLTAEPHRQPTQQSRFEVLEVITAHILDTSKLKLLYTEL